MLRQPGECRPLSAQGGETVSIFAEEGRTEMMMGHRFLAKTFDVYKIAIVVVGCVTLAAHAPGTVALQGLEVAVDHIERMLLPFRQYGK